MRVSIEQVDKGSFRVADLAPYQFVQAADEKSLKHCMSLSLTCWRGVIDGSVACMWGLIPPTILSEQAYLWLYTTSLVDKHKFVLVRHSQLMLEKMLKDFPTIVGHCAVGNNRAIRWVKWLGGTFGQPTEKLIPFRIRRKHG